MRTIFVLLTYWWVPIVGAQGPVCIDVTHQGSAQSEWRSMQPINRFALTCDSVYEPLDLASASPNQAAQVFSFIRPNNWNESASIRSSYFWVYARTGNSGPIQDHCLVLVQEQLIKGQWVRVYWVDPTGDLDFRNCQGDTLWDLMRPWILTVSPGISLQMEPFPVARFSSFAHMHDESMRSLCGPRIYMGASSAFRYQRLNLRWGEYPYDSAKQVYIAVQDQNFNGKYGDVGVDKVLISLDSSYFNDEEAIPWEPRTGAVHAVWRGRPWEIQLRGNQLCIQTLEEGNHPLIKGQRLPRIRYELVAGGLFSPQKLGVHRSWRPYRKQPLILYVWQPDMGLPSSDSLALSRFSNAQQQAWQELMSRYKQEHEGEEPSIRVLRSWLKDPESIVHIRLLMLAQGGNARYISTLNRRFDFAFDQIVLENRAARKMQWQSLPQNLELDKCGRIVDADANLQVLLDF